MELAKSSLGLMDTDSPKSVIIVDICNTLYDSNTTYDFIRFCIQTGRLSNKARLMNQLLLSRISPLFWSVSVIQKLLNDDLFKKVAVSFLKGHSVEEIDTWSKEFYQAYLSSKTIECTFSILKKYKADEVVLVSSTLLPIAKVIAAENGLPHFIATELEILGNVYTGKIKNELSGRKLSAIKQKFSDQVKIDVVMSDNFTDKELMAVSSKSFAVCYNQKQETFWSKLPQVTIVRIPNSI